jgi:hypothetical protein
MFGDGVGSNWWHALNQIRTGVGLTDPRWLEDNIIWKVGDGRSTLFWLDPWWEGCPLARSFGRLFELAENKLVTVSEMFVIGWGLVVRRGSGGGGYLLGRRSWWWSVWRRFLLVLCRMAWLTGGYGSSTRLSAIRFNPHMPT